ISEINESIFSNVNLNLGISYQIGRVAKQKDAVKMLSLEENIEISAPEFVTDEEKIKEEQLEDVNTFAEEKIDTIGVPKVEIQTDPQYNNQKIVETENKFQENEEVPYENQEPESTEITEYDELGGQFLYKAGESYFQNNDFENAIACFVKLK